MTNNREEQIYKAADKATYQTPPQYSKLVHKSRKVMCAYEIGFIEGAEWADQHPQWYDAQGDDVPEYGREVIVIGRDGKVFYGHRPDPKEVTMVEGKPYHAKTYDKNGWNWPDIALWLNVEVPHEMVDKIVTDNIVEAITDFCAGWRAADSHPAWVSVEERLPEKENEFEDYSKLVVVTNGKDFWKGMYNYGGEDWRTFDLWLIDDATHWMEIVPPVKKGGQDETAK